jgi:hypothetical protein
MNVNKAIIAVSMQRATTQLGLIFARATVVSTELDLIAQVFSRVRVEFERVILNIRRCG